MWVGVFPELAEVGGIQQVCRHAGAVLAKNAADRNVTYRLLGLNDASGPGTFRVGADEYSFTGFGRNKLALSFFLFRLSSQVETLHFGHVNLSPLGLFLRFLHPRIKYWVWAHGTEVWTRLPLIRRAALRRAFGVTAVSSFTATEMAKVQGLNPRSVSVVFPALDPGFLEAAAHAEAPSTPPQDLVLLTVGRLVSSEPGKGVNSVIKVLPDALKAVPDLFYVIAGGGDLQPRLEELARTCAARDRIVFLGKVSLEKLRGCFSRADLFVMPSRQEGFGIVLVEAMALGKPVIAGDRGGATEIVEDGVTGFLVDPDDLAALTNRLIQLLQDGALRRKMGDAGRRIVEQKYTFERFAKRLAEIWGITP